MEKLKNLLKLLVVSLVSVLLASCSSYKDIRVEDGRLVSVRPEGLRSVELVVELDVNNPGPSAGLEDISGVLKVGGDPYVNLSSSDVVLKGHCVEKYLLSIHGTIYDDKTILDVLRILQNLDMLDFSADVQCNFKHWTGLEFRREYRDLKFNNDKIL